MKKAFVFLLSVFILGCTPQKQADSTADNSRYQWDNIRKYLMEEPAYALALVDTARLLSETDEPVNLIAEMSGFASRAYFNEKFRERFKMTPSEFRKASGK